MPFLCEHSKMVFDQLGNPVFQADDPDHFEEIKQDPHVKPVSAMTNPNDPAPPEPAI